MSNPSSGNDRLISNESHSRKTGEQPLVLRVEDLAQILAIGRNTAYELVRSGKIKSIRIGKCYRITMDAITEYLEQRQNTT